MSAAGALARRWGVWMVVVGVAVIALVVGASRSAPPTLLSRERAVEAQVRCPVCQGESVAQSSVPAALTIRNQIVTEMQAGKSASDVIGDLEHSYGPTILEKPPYRGVSLVVWILPAVIGLVGLAGLGAALARWRRRSGVGGVGGVGGGAGGSSASPDDDMVALALASRRAER